MRDPFKGHAALRKGRWSAQDTLYFITICLIPGQTGLDSHGQFESSLKILKALEEDTCNEVHALVHMPNHIHVLIELGNQTQLAEVIRLYKGRMSPRLRTHQLSWQGGYHDRRLRPNDSVGSVLRYMILNPYRKELLEAHEEWPYWYCTEEAKTWISIAEEKNVPLPEWI